MSSSKLTNNRWLLPEGIEELLPPRARVLEQLRRNLLDLFDRWGYDLVMPPFIEYLDSLLTATGNDLDLQTFKLTDQLTGRLMGVRADMTPQVARIDAHHIKSDHPVRLCYLGSVLRTRPEGMAGSRCPLQIGAELYGHGGVESDSEIVHLMVETLAATGLSDIHLDLGHVGIYRGLARQFGLDAGREAQLFSVLQGKASKELSDLLQQWGIDSKGRQMFLDLITLNGRADEVLSAARRSLVGADKPVQQALDQLHQLATLLAARLPELALHFDLAELRGYHYHTGVVFAAYVPGYGQAVAQGGRYDDIGQVFGRARPATGFSADLKTLINLSSAPLPDHNSGAIFAPFSDDSTLWQEIAALRAKGERVVCALPGQQGDGAAMGCDRQLVNSGGRWQIQKR